MGKRVVVFPEDCKEAGIVRDWKRALKRGLGPKQRKALRLWEKFGGKCGICGEGIPHPLESIEKLTKFTALNIDHIKPLSRNGRNRPTNLQPSHAYCNSRKGNKWQ